MEPPTLTLFIPSTKNKHLKHGELNPYDTKLHQISNETWDQYINQIGKEKVMKKIESLSQITKNCKQECLNVKAMDEKFKQEEELNLGITFSSHKIQL